MFEDAGLFDLLIYETEVVELFASNRAKYDLPVVQEGTAKEVGKIVLERLLEESVLVEMVQEADTIDASPSSLFFA